MAQYNTRQKGLLLNCLRRNSERAMSVEELTEMLFAESDTPPGKSTVYRLVSRLAEEGAVRRFEDPETRKAKYQIIDSEACHHHLHLKCVECGKLLHMDHAQSERIIDGIFDDSDFTVSQEETTLFGVCGECRTAGGRK
ncbi:MAG: transcriptional repressor [Clostridia bacterium]|nr:transcriptional repressor [Clostridia bacterium]